MQTTVPNTEEVRIINSDNNTYYYFSLRKDRLADFFVYLMAHRNAGQPASVMPGISGPAHYALDCLFFGPKPTRFPAKDILDWIRNQQLAQLGAHPNPTISSQEVEYALGQWAGTVTQLLADGSDKPV
jgi:hypothetical protein